MSRSRSPRAFLALLLLVSLALAGLPGAAPLALSVPVARADHGTASPSAVTLAGDLQDELGCPSDWDPTCVTTHLESQGNGVWRGVFSVPAGSWQYKMALNNGWTESYAGNHTQGDNTTLSVSTDPTQVRFYYDHKTHAVLDSETDVIAHAAGTFQDDLGCPGEWSPTCVSTLLTDKDGDGIYTFKTSDISQGNHEFKIVLDESWDPTAYPANNVAFNVPAAGSSVTITYNSTTNAVNVAVTAPGAAHDNNIFWSDLGHNSRDSFYRSPGGAVTTGTPVTLRFRAAQNDLTAVRVRLWNDLTDAESFISMQRVATDGTYEWWEAQLPASNQPTIYWYRFVAVDGTASVSYEDDSARTGGWGAAVGTSADISWQISVYDPSFETPDWVKDAVIYQIFADRFRDGDPANNTPAGVPFYETTTITRSNGVDWNTPICDPRGAICPNVWSENFYGGDLQGIVDQLGYLDDLGVTAIYLNPIFESPSNHKYDTTDFSVIDDHFGDLDTFHTLVEQAGAHGMRIILDGVFNHTSSDSIYFDRYGRYPTVGACESPTSPYRDWFYFTDVAAGAGDCVSSTGVANGATYVSWFGYDSLPKLDSANQEVRDLIWSGDDAIAPYWIEQGADGWRLDVGGDVDPGLTNNPSNNYWEGFRDAVRTATLSETYIVGEEWGNATPWTLGQEWDATMNYGFSSALLSFWRDEAFVDNDHNSGSSAGILTPLTPSQLDERLRNLQERYPAESFYAMMNLLDSHDTNRALFMLDHNADQYNQALYQDSGYDWSDAIERLKGVVLLQMTLPGAPTIYYGDEVGLVGPVGYDGSTWQDDPYNRQPYPWLDASGTPFYEHLRAAERRIDLLSHYQLLTAARNNHEALRTGSFDTLLTDDANKVYAYGRRTADLSDAAVVITNRSNSVTQTITLNLRGYLPTGAQLTNVFDDTSYTVNPAGEVQITLLPREGALLVLSSPAVAPPAAVDDLVATPGPGQVVLSWSAVAGPALTYDIYQLADGAYAHVDSVLSTVYTDTGLLNGQRYYYVVVARDVGSGLTSGYSNVASAMPRHDLTTAWYNMQWPPTLTHTISASTPTEYIYGQLYIAGATGGNGPAEGILAQVGWGPRSDLPTAASWTWSDMAYLGAVGNNDEYRGTLLPDQLGDFYYTTRYSSDGGATWYYADLDGPGYTEGRGGLLHVVASADTTAPDAPSSLVVANTTPGSISLVWSVSPSGDVAGYEVYRRLQSGGGAFERLASVAASTLTYQDLDVVTGETYEYYVVAFDDSYNRSSASNMVPATAEARQVVVTFNVTVPAFTPPSTIVIVGNQPEIGSWSESGVPLTQVDATTWTITRTFLHGTQLQYKFSRGSWLTVEKEADGNTEITNRTLTVDYGANGTQVVNLSVANWRDPLVVSHSPLEGATGVPIDSTIVVTWSQKMKPTTTIAVQGPGGAVAGSAGLDASGTVLIFTPTLELAFSSTYTVTASGAQDVASDAQQVPTSWSFSTEGGATVGFASASATVDEGSGTVSVTVTLESASQHEVTVDYATVVGTAGSADYQPISGTLTFAPGQTSRTIVLTIVDDAVREPGETFTLVLSSPRYATLGSSVYTLTIRDDEVVVYLPLVRLGP